MNDANENQPKISPEVTCCDEQDFPVDKSLLRDLYLRADAVEGVVHCGQNYLFGKLDAIRDLCENMEPLIDSMKEDIMDYFEEVKNLLRAVYAIKDEGKSDGVYF